MTYEDFRDLTILSVTSPGQAGRVLVQLNLPRQTLWMALILAAVLNTILTALSGLLVPSSGALPPIMDVPFAYLGFVLGGLVIFIYAVYLTGRAMGGQGSAEDVMIMMVWLQVLRLIVQAAAIVLLLTVPVLAALALFAAALYGIYILLHFVNEAHRLNSIGRAAGVLIASVVAMVLGLSMLISLFGAPFIGA